MVNSISYFYVINFRTFIGLIQLSEWLIVAWRQMSNCSATYYIRWDDDDTVCFVTITLICAASYHKEQRLDGSE
jgi:hypothetical protein